MGGAARSPRHGTAVGISLLGFLMLFGYAMARPATESLFLAAHGSHGLPLVWAAVALTAVLVVGAYNAAAGRMGLTALLLAALGLSALSLAVLLSVRTRWPGPAAFALYVWKDVHIVVLLEALWTMANVVFPTRTARVAYGLFCAAGSIGGISGNLLVGPVAASWGTAATLWGALGVFALQVPLVVGLGRVAGRPGPRRSQPASLGEGLRVLARSSYLGRLLALVAVVQIVITLVDYQYNTAIEAAYPALDDRTAVIGRVYAAIDGSSLLLQLSTAWILRAVGLRWTLLGIPLLLGTALGAFALVPRFGVMAVSKVASKALDYSLFRAAKEMLYIPLSYAEKTRGKALVDMLTYRVAKGGSSLIVAPLVGVGLALPVILAALALVCGWAGLTWQVVRRYERLIGGGRPDDGVTP